MEFEWDEDKRQNNLVKHDVDFVGVQALFDGRPVYTTLSSRFDEDRYVTTDLDRGRYYTVVWTWRAGVIRLISARRARDAEKREHRTLYGGGT
jgi:uncharacterized DUF497 family protein